METTTGSSFWFVFSACIGGVVVLVGLLMELLAEKKWFKTIEAFRRWESIKHWGERLVIFGIVIEVVVAGWLAKSEWQNDAWNKPIANASAFASIITSQNPRPSSFFNLSPEYEMLGWRAFITFINGTSLNGSNVLLQVEASQSEASAWNMGSTTNREWRISFHENSLDFLKSESDRNKILVKQFDGVNALILSMPFETNMVVESGYVVLTVNNFKWTFHVPRQKPKWGIISMQRIKGSTGHIETQVLPVPISDFVYPPRFMNRVYDGK